ncbi:uncharacterized protein LOC110253726 isoform X2 [Exaiptasia diaphana]|uniref:CxC1-like cysteine cluster associated with KDZ transposases domain-containing protein n=1 Tax=Exaiptasia diaphana TaxID=2652724 RepID=A0A913YV36_EXADI|nr:uncharacterized protein LOC110253726 isoform X2 [Exaiptasia diaphana]
MKKIRAVKLKTTFISRSGKRCVYVPVNSVNSAKKSTEKRFEQTSQASSITREVSIDEPSACNLTLHQKRQVFTYNNWKRVRDSIFNAFIDESHLPRDATCIECNKEAATIRCQDCGTRQFFCEQCAENLHSKRNHFHILEVWQDEMFSPLYADHGVVGYGHNCSTKVLQNFTLVDSSGRQHVKRVEVCECEPIAVSLVRCNFWPGSPVKPTTAFHISLMNLLEKLFLQCQVSLYDFGEVLNLLQPQLGKTVSTSLYGTLNSGSFEEFRQFKYHMQYLHNFCPGLNNGTQCELCPKDKGVMIESLDACMGLARKKKKGGGLVEPRHEELMFSDQTDVDNFVDNYGKEGIKIEENCNRFHAGEVLSSLRSKGKNQLFDEKGVFGRVCRHDFPKGFVNLKYGERISYSIYEINKLKESLKDKPGVKLIIMYDIACILSSHLSAPTKKI